jgi:hypothetical protein
MAETALQPSPGTAAQGLLTDIERVLGQRLGRFKDEGVGELGKATTAGASVGGGLGVTTPGTILGGLAFVQLVKELTGLPLSVCYAGAALAACTVGAGLVADGVQQAKQLDIIPEGTGQALRQAVTRTGNGR